MEKRVLFVMLFVFLALFSFIFTSFAQEEIFDRQICSEPGTVKGVFICDGSEWVECREGRKNNLVFLPPNNNLGRCNTKSSECASFYEAVTCSQEDNKWKWNPKPHCFSNAKSVAEMKKIKNFMKKQTEKYIYKGLEEYPIFADDWCNVCSPQGALPTAEGPCVRGIGEQGYLVDVPPDFQPTGGCSSGKCLFTLFPKILCLKFTIDAQRCAKCESGRWEALPEGTPCSWKVIFSLDKKRAIYRQQGACSGIKPGKGECAACFLRCPEGLCSAATQEVLLYRNNDFKSLEEAFGWAAQYLPPQNTELYKKLEGLFICPSQPASAYFKIYPKPVIYGERKPRFGMEIWVKLRITF